MTDIVERLRALVIMDEVGSDNPLGREAAAEIERLRAEHEVTSANLHAWMRLKADAEARLAEAVEAQKAESHFADELRTELGRAVFLLRMVSTRWEDADDAVPTFSERDQVNAFLAKLEG